MIELKCDQTTFFDVDETLILWEPTETQLFSYGKTYTAPGGHQTILVPHLPHVEQLKKHKIRGHTIVVWSAGGAFWAAEAVKFLGLEGYVDLVISKPVWYYDDKTAEEFMGKPYYFKAQE